MLSIRSNNRQLTSPGILSSRARLESILNLQLTAQSRDDIKSVHYSFCVIAFVIGLQISFAVPVG